jgi:hypothetical protein
MTREQWEALRACVEVAEDDNPLWYAADEALVQIGRENGWITPDTSAQPACDGAMDSEDNPICNGPDVQCCHVESPNGTPFIANWCSECRELAIHDGMKILKQHPINQKEF